MRRAAADAMLRHRYLFDVFAPKGCGKYRVAEPGTGEQIVGRKMQR